MPAKLTLFPTRGASRYFVFREGKNHVAGRDPSSDLELSDPRVSARHALFQWTGNDWILVDLRSKNGTFVNDARITEVPLQNGDWLSFGGLRAQLEKVSEEDVKLLASERGGRLQEFVQARRDLEEHLEPQSLLRQLIQSALFLTGAERGFVLIIKSTGEIDALVAAGFTASESVDERLDGVFEAIEAVLATGAAIATSRAKTQKASAVRRSAIDLGHGALVCAGLKSDGRIIGLICAAGRKRGGVFTELDLEILESLADHAARRVASLSVPVPIRELVGSPSAPGGSQRFLDELERRAVSIVREATRVPRPTL